MSTFRNTIPGLVRSSTCHGNIITNMIFHFTYKWCIKIMVEYGIDMRAPEHQWCCPVQFLLYCPPV